MSTLSLLREERLSAEGERQLAIARTSARALLKIANDIRLLGSGPRCGLGELVIPHDGLTSSIMPGKRNPTLAEVLAQAAYQAAGNHVTVTMAAAAGAFELNVAKPVIIYNVLQSIRVLADASRIFSARLVKNLAVDRARLASYVSNSLLLTTSLNPVLGYDKVAQITARALEDGSSPREAALSLGFLSGEEYDGLTDAWRMIGKGAMREVHWPKPGGVDCSSQPKTIR